VRRMDSHDDLRRAGLANPPSTSAVCSPLVPAWSCSAPKLSLGRSHRSDPALARVDGSDHGRPLPACAPESPAMILDFGMLAAVLVPGSWLPWLIMRVR
jgi:hypothetical protein